MPAAPPVAVTVISPLTLAFTALSVLKIPQASAVPPVLATSTFRSTEEFVAPPAPPVADTLILLAVKATSWGSNAAILIPYAAAAPPIPPVAPAL